MRIFALRMVSIILFSATCLVAGAQTITLYPAHDPVTKKYDEGKACFSFKQGLLKKDTGKEWDLGYGFLSMSEPSQPGVVTPMEDWFVLNTTAENRSVIVDLGPHKWDSSIKIPVLEPLPEVPKGKHRQITIDASGADGAPGARGLDGLPGRNGYPGDRNRETHNDPNTASSQDLGHTSDGVSANPASETRRVTTQPGRIIAKIVKGNMYLVHVKNETSDYYAMFRVEEFEQNGHCTISWRIVQPGQSIKNL